MSDAFQLYSEEGGLASEISCDDSTGLPLLSEQQTILRLVHNYLPLPYSVVEYGCGQKASIVIRMLARHENIPPFALHRGLVMERDLGPEALAETNPENRPHALTAPNTMARRAEPENPIFRRFLEENGTDLSVEDEIIQVGKTELALADRVQFVIARSHVFPILTFWDERNRCPADRVIDLTLDRQSLFPVQGIRDRLNAPESWILIAPLMGRFRLDPGYLTKQQSGEVEETLQQGEDLFTLSRERHAGVFRSLSGARHGSLGDPEEWSLTNNVFVKRDEKSRENLLEQTGRGEPARVLTRQLLEARKHERLEEVKSIRRELLEFAREWRLREILQEEAERCEHELSPLAKVADLISCFRSLRRLHENLQSGEDPFSFPVRPGRLRHLHGIGVRLRRRIETAAHYSRDEVGRIDARALNDRYFRVAAETIRQMNRAGLTVFIDQVGNLHGLWIDSGTRESVKAGEVSLSELIEGALCFVSHIDTVLDAGKYDGRLGVFSGIEIVQVLRDIEQYFDFSIRRNSAPCPLVVSAYSGEEMTFTGEDVSLPGSAAVSGLADVRKVYQMTNGAGERYHDRLQEMGRYLIERRRRGEISFLGLGNSDETGDPFASAGDPTEFYPHRSWERHIEQGLILHRRDVPLSLTDTIVGVRHEDFILTGAEAEAAGWEFVRSCRKLLTRDRFNNARLTCGVFDAGGPPVAGTGKVEAREWHVLGSGNHAGTTVLRDRRDAAVGAARLGRKFSEMVEDLSPGSRELVPLVSGSVVNPGNNRNVIPAEAKLVLGIRGELTGSERSDIEERLGLFAEEILSRPVNEGGEGVQVEPGARVDLPEPASKVRVSIDLRHESAAVMEEIRNAIGENVTKLSDRFGIHSVAKLHQDSPPVSVSKSGHVLQMERSYGGSHNPRESELAADVLRGMLFQFAVTCAEIRGEKRGEGSLYGRAFARLPEEWKKGGFVSGGFHDTANLAMAASDG